MFLDTKWRGLVGVLIAVGMALGLGVAQADDNRLSVTQDESSMERTIKSYLTTVSKLTVKENMDAGDDLTLTLPFESDPMPVFSVSIDTQASNRDKNTNAVLERAILISLKTTVKVPPGKRAAVLEALNDFNCRNMFSSIYIDAEGEITCDWSLNVLPEGLPTECVYDAVVRVGKNWKELHPEVVKALS